MSLYISIDPGIKKCGLLLADMQSGKVIEAGIASLNKFSDLVALWNEDYQIIKIIIGDGTNCRHIENQFDENMSWDNVTRSGWHIDHIRPCASFDLSMDNPQRFVCYNWRNLQPMLAIENMTKQDEYTPLDETEWVERMLSLDYEGELFLKYEEGNSY